MGNIFISVLALAGLLLTACSAAVTPTAAPSATSTTLPPTAVPLPTPTGEPLPTSTSEPLPVDVLAIYHKRGCFDGIDDTLTIHSNGTLELVDRQGTTQRAQADIAQLAALQDLLAQPEFKSLRPLYQAMGADLCVYTITARLDGQTFSVTTMDAAETPDFLQQVIAAADRLRSEIKP
jgi:hypothetical protein